MMNTHLQFHQQHHLTQLLIYTVLIDNQPYLVLIDSGSTVYIMDITSFQLSNANLKQCDKKYMNTMLIYHNISSGYVLQ